MDHRYREPYYAAAKAPGRLPETTAERRLQGVLSPQAYNMVLETVKRWNPLLRAEVRAMTALKLVDDSSRSSVSIQVSVVDGMPKPLAAVTSDLQTCRSGSGGLCFSIVC